MSALGEMEGSRVLECRLNKQTKQMKTILFICLLDLLSGQRSPAGVQNAKRSFSRQPGVGWVGNKKNHKPIHALFLSC